MRRQRRWRTTGAANGGAPLSVDTRDTMSDILAALCGSHCITLLYDEMSGLHSRMCRGTADE